MTIRESNSLLVAPFGPRLAEYEYQQEDLTFLCRQGQNDEPVIRGVLQGEYDIPDHSDYEPNSVTIDIGAHVGSYALLVCKLLPSQRVLAVEPLPQNLQTIQANLERNGFSDRVALVHAGIGFSGENIKVCYADSTSPDRFIGNGMLEPGPSVQYVTVPSLTLDNLMAMAEKTFGVRKIWLLKVDTEGGEYGFFERSSPEALARVKYIVGEEHDLNKTFGLYSDFHSKLKGLGFSEHRHWENHTGNGIDWFLFQNQRDFRTL